jgi:hypothetical protein
MASERDFEAAKFMMRLIPMKFGIEVSSKCLINLAGSIIVVSSISRFGTVGEASARYLIQAYVSTICL